MQFLFVSVHLSCKVVRFGRNPMTCDFTYKGKEHQIAKEVYGQISNHHFSIHQYDRSAYLEDTSLHGTFVNGNLVGSAEPNGKRQVLLETGDKISVVNADGPCKFPFICPLT